MVNMYYNRYNEGKTIEDFLDNNITPYSIEETSILNMCLTNGTMGRSDQLKLRELYPGLFSAVEKFLNQKKRGHIFIYEEEGKPKIVNFFVHSSPKNNNCEYWIRKSALKGMFTYIRNGKIPSRHFVWINDKEEKHKKMIENSIQYKLGWNYTFVAVRQEAEERN